MPGLAAAAATSVTISAAMVPAMPTAARHLVEHLALLRREDCLQLRGRVAHHRELARHVGGKVARLRAIVAASASFAGRAGGFAHIASRAFT